MKITGMEWVANDVLPGTHLNIKHPPGMNGDLANGKNMYDDLVIVFYRQQGRPDQYGVVMTGTGCLMSLTEDRDDIAKWLTANAAVPRDVVIPGYFERD